MPKKIITEDIESEIICFYKTSPMTIRELGIKFNLSDPTIIKILNKYNIKRYSKSRLYNPSMNEEYFKNIDSSNKAYFLGLIIADGNVFDDNTGRQASISITLKEEDKYILEKFKKELNINTSVNDDGRGAYTIAVRSNKIKDDLLKYGIYERKSFNTSLPKIQDEYMGDLIRGIIDGDGSIQAKQTNIRNRFKHSVGICGTKLLMNQIKEYLVNTIGVTNVSVYTYKSRRLSMVTWSSIEDMFKLYEYLYKDSEIFLLRKNIKFRCILEHYDSSYQFN